MSKLIFTLIFFAGLFFIYRRTKFTSDQFLDYPASEPIRRSQNFTNSYTVGAYSYAPELTLLQKLNRKKINNYLFAVGNQHKIEVALVDLGYAKAISASYFSQEHTFNFEDESISFSLPESFSDHSFTINNTVKSSQFFLRSNPTEHGFTTELLVRFSKGNNHYHLNLTYHQPYTGCVTYLRNQVTSYKCYTGQAQGTFNIQIQDQHNSFQTQLSIGLENCSAGFDGFRGSGWEWYWIWGMGAGLIKSNHISINFGSMRGIGEDVLHIGDRVIPITGIEYTVNRNATVGDSLRVKSSALEMEMQFRITSREHRLRDLGILKVDLLRFEGYWSGSFKLPETSEVYGIEALPGLVEVGDSIF